MSMESSLVEKVPDLPSMSMESSVEERLPDVPVESSLAGKLPDVPKDEPKGSDEPRAKKKKLSDAVAAETDDEWEKIEKPHQATVEDDDDEKTN